MCKMYVWESVRLGHTYIVFCVWMSTKVKILKENERQEESRELKKKQISVSNSKEVQSL